MLLTAPGPAPADTKAPALLVPFTRAAKEHVEQFVDVSQILTGNSTQLGPWDVPAYGFMRGLILQVDATGGVSGVATAKQADAPWSAIQEVAVFDVNGAPLIGPFSGYDLYLVNKYGGYAPNSPDPKQASTFSDVAVGAAASGNFSFLLRIPVEVGPRDGLGSLANQNSASTYKLRITLAGSALIYSTVPSTTLPTVRIRVSLDAWTQPTATDLRGNANATQPPAHGTTSYWSKTVVNLASGQQTVRLPRVGNYIRELIFIWRQAAGPRISTTFPDPASLYWDTRLLKSLPQPVWKDALRQKLDLTAAAEAARGLDTGVFVEDYAHEFDGSIGYELRDGWLPTVQSTRLELQGNFGEAGSLSIITNDISPAGEIFV